MVTIYDLSTGNTLVTLNGLEAEVRAIAFRADGKQLATSLDDHTLRIWDAADGKELRRISYKEKSGLLDQISFHRNGQYVAGSDFGEIEEVLGVQKGWSSGPAGKALVWDVESGQTVDVHAQARASFFDRAGARLLTVQDGRAMAWFDSETWRQADKNSSAYDPTTPILSDEHIYSIALSTDDKWLALGLEMEMSNAPPNGETIGAPQGKISTEPSDDGTSVTVSAAEEGYGGYGGYLDAAGNVIRDSRVRGNLVILKNLADGATRTIAPSGGGRVMALAFSPDGRKLAWGALHNGRVHIRDLVSNKQEILEAHDDGVCALAWTPDSRQLISGSYDQTVKVWDVASQKLVQLLGESLYGYAMAWCPNQDKLAVAGWDTVRIWNVQKREVEAVLTGFADQVRSVAWSPDGKQIAAVGKNNSVVVWDATTHKIVRQLQSSCAILESIAWSPDGKKLAALGANWVTHIWDASSTEMLGTFSPQGDSFGFSFTPRNPFTRLWTAPFLRWSLDSNHLAVATDIQNGSPKRIEVFGVSLQPITKRFGDRSTMTIAWQPGTGRIATTDGSVWRLIETDTGKELWQRRDLENYRPPNPLAFSPDGRRLVAGRGTNVIVHDSATGDEILSLREFQNTPITAVAFSNSGGMLFVGANDGSVRCYNGTPLKRTPSKPIGPLGLYNQAAAILTGDVRRSVPTADGYDLEVIVESIQKDDSGELIPSDRVKIKYYRPGPKNVASLDENGLRATRVVLDGRVRFYLASKSNNVWTTVYPGNSVVLVERDPSGMGDQFSTFSLP
jgi:WD40 repeat protein